MTGWLAGTEAGWLGGCLAGWLHRLLAVQSFISRICNGFFVDITSSKYPCPIIPFNNKSSVHHTKNRIL